MLIIKPTKVYVVVSYVGEYAKLVALGNEN
jgi:hypothetical protein